MSVNSTCSASSSDVEAAETEAAPAAAPADRLRSTRWAIVAFAMVALLNCSSSPKSPAPTAVAAAKSPQVTVACKPPDPTANELLGNPAQLEKDAANDPYKRWLYALYVKLGPEKASQAYLAASFPEDLIGTEAQVRILWDRAAAANRDPKLQKSLLNQARQAATILRHKALIARTDLKLARWLIDNASNRDDYRTAATQLESVVNRARQLNPDPMRILPRALLNLSLANLNLDRYDDTIKLCLEVKGLIEPDCPETGTAELNIGWSLFQLGEFQRSFDHTTAAKNLFQNAAHQSELWKPLENLAGYHNWFEEWDKAQKKLAEAQAVAAKYNDDQTQATIWSDRARVAVAAKDFGLASRALSEAKRLSNFQGSIGSQNDALLVFIESRIHAGRGEFGPADKGYRSVLDSPKANNSIRIEAAYFRARLLATAMGRQADAEAQFKEGEKLIEKVRGSINARQSKLSFSANPAAYYDSYIDFLVDAKKFEQALIIADGSRARQLSDGKSTGLKRLDLPSLQKQLSSVGGVALFYWIGNKNAKAYLWIVDKDAVKRPLVIDKNPAEIQASAQAYAKAVSSGRPLTKEDLAIGCGLRKTVLDPAIDYLTKNRAVFMVLDGALALLNPESLPAWGCPAGQWLINEVNVSVAPSLAMLQSPPPVRKSARKLLAIGNANATPGFPLLPNAADELHAITEGLLPAQYQVIEGTHATPASYLNGNPAQYEMIHFAAHGEAQADDPLDSAVVLSDEESETQVSKLYARVIVERPIGARLVTISACKSALSRYYHGEGAVGLAWAFLRAGAGQVVAGLWNVDDDSARELMPRFYQGMRTGLGPAQALREAKLKIMEGYPQPYDWAVFEIFAGYIEPPKR